MTTTQLITSNDPKGQFVREEMRSTYGYLSGYKPMHRASFEVMLADLEMQAKTIDNYFGVGVTLDIDFARRSWEVVPTQAPWIDGLFVSIAKNVIARDYNSDTHLVLEALRKDRNPGFYNCSFYNYREGRLGPRYLRQSKRSVIHEDSLAAMQKSGMKLIVEPGNFGVRHVISNDPPIHTTASVRRAIEKMVAGEYGAGIKKSGTWVLCTPNRINNYSDLWIHCLGDEVAPRADGVFSESPVLSFREGWLGLDTIDVSDIYHVYGSVSGFVPQN